MNLPILTEIAGSFFNTQPPSSVILSVHKVRPEGRSTILAWESALESTFAAILGNAMAAC